MSAYTDRVDAARNRSGNLYRQIVAAAWSAAAAIQKEAIGTAQHTRRMRWSDSIRNRGIAGADEFAERVLPQVLEVPAIAASPEGVADAVVQAAVDALVNDWLDRG